MNILTSKQYETEKYNFLNKHNDWQVETSQMNEYGSYHKEYICDNGDIWYEVMRPIHETVEFEVKGVKFEQTVELFEVEFWNNKDANSKFYYEKF